MTHRTADSARARMETRDRGLRHVRAVTGWIAAASAAGAVVLAGGYAQAMPGKTASTTPIPGHAGAVSGTGAPASASSSPTSAPVQASASAGRPAPSSAAPAPATSSAPVLQPPAQVPTTAASTAQATSGGS